MENFYCYNEKFLDESKVSYQTLIKCVSERRGEIEESFLKDYQEKIRGIKDDSEHNLILIAEDALEKIGLYVSLVKTEGGVHHRIFGMKHLDDDMKSMIWEVDLNSTSENARVYDEVQEKLETLKFD